MVDFPTSSSVASAEYDDDKHELRVTFRGGATYAYSADASVWADLQTAPSPGQYVHTVLKGLGGRRV